MTGSISRRIPCSFMRGGTSRGAYFLSSDLPTSPDVLDDVILYVFGSPDARQINGLGGGDPLTSKVAIVGPSERSDADVDFTFGQVSIDTAEIFWKGNCGNMSAGVGPFAIAQGLVPPESPVTTVRIYTKNTDQVLVARVPVLDAQVVEEGDTYIAGVPEPGAAIYLDFGDCGGAVSGSILPTGSPRNSATLSNGETIEVSIVDASTPFVFVTAKSIGISGVETVDELSADIALLDRLEEIRGFAAEAIGIVGNAHEARELSPSIPRVTVISPPSTYVASDGSTVAEADSDLVVRQLSMQRLHKTFAVTGTVCTAVAATIPGTVVHETARAVAEGSLFRIGHPGGTISARVRMDGSPADPRVAEASIARTARLIMDGHAHVPARIWPS
jgi:2-methylaconitate cis-trans-isomerase PrpF